VRVKERRPLEQLDTVRAEIAATTRNPGGAAGIGAAVARRFADEGVISSAKRPSFWAIAARS